MQSFDKKNFKNDKTKITTTIKKIKQSFTIKSCVNHCWRQ